MYIHKQIQAVVFLYSTGVKHVAKTGSTKYISDKLHMSFDLHFEYIVFGFESDTTVDLDKVI